MSTCRSSFRTQPLTEHTRTQIDIIGRFLPVAIRSVAIGDERAYDVSVARA